MEYYLDSHVHTIASGHAYNTIFEMAEAAAQKGLKLLALTEHAVAMPGTCHEFYFSNLRMLPRRIKGIEVLFGAEVNIMDYEGNVDMDEGLLAQMDVVVASLHTPCIRPGTREENTKALLGAMKNPYVNIIGHPDDGRYPVDFEALVQTAKERHVLLELNNTSLHPKGSRKDPKPNDREMLRLCSQYQVPIIVNSDAHSAFDVGEHGYAEALLKEMRFPGELIVNRSVEEYKKYINRKESGTF